MILAMHSYFLGVSAFPKEKNVILSMEGIGNRRSGMDEFGSKELFGRTRDHVLFCCFIF
jgi:hypothetical protein